MHASDFISDASTQSSGETYCAAQTRRFDRDRYLCSLWAPVDRRQDIFTLLAFNLEVAQIAETVSEPLIGHMRLQWWRDAIDGIFIGHPPNHPVATALAQTVTGRNLKRPVFDSLLDARAFDLEGEAPADQAALLAYVEATSAGLTGLALDILGVDSEEARSAGRDVGMAWGLVGLLRALPFHARARRCYLPIDLCRDAQVDLDSLFAGRPGNGLKTVVAHLAALARDHLNAARRTGAGALKIARPALLPATLADGYLRRLSAAGHDPFVARPGGAGAGQMIRLALNAYRGRF